MRDSVSTAELEHYRDRGYIILRKAVSAQCIESLKAAINRLIDRALRGEVEIPFIDRDKAVVSRIGSMMQPPRYDAAYADWHEQQLCGLVDAILGEPGRYSLFGMLASGGGQGYDTGWHRDLTPAGRPQDPAVMINSLTQPFTQFNAPIFGSDRYLVIVPASHNRPGTDAETAVVNTDKCADMPGQMTVELESGDIAFYNPLLWHRGYNPRGDMRWSMHAAYHRARSPVMRHEAGQQDLDDPAYLDALPPRMRQYIERYLAIVPADRQDAPNMADIADQLAAA